jgi:hypothetical protein
MSDREVMKQALDALERCSIRLDDRDFRESVLLAIDALRAALAQQQAEPVVVQKLEKLSPDDNLGNPSY